MSQLGHGQSHRQREYRFLADEGLARRVLSTASRHLQVDQAERRSPWVTTTYCDTADWRIYRADEVGPAQHLRFREYHPSRADEAFASPSMFLEVKDNSRGRRSKERLEVTASVLPALLRREWNLPATLNRRDQVHFLLAAG
ncbi:MAG: VTC domain-containing protein, partial [Chloroflexi bacterium]|nr:VTC domain-containing protein [Chloroflexota bacterium]